jgi:hypothetical protein
MTSNNLWNLFSFNLKFASRLSKSCDIIWFDGVRSREAEDRHKRSIKETRLLLAYIAYGHYQTSADRACLLSRNEVIQMKKILDAAPGGIWSNSSRIAAVD